MTLISNAVTKNMVEDFVKNAKVSTAFHKRQLTSLLMMLISNAVTKNMVEDFVNNAKSLNCFPQKTTHKPARYALLHRPICKDTWIKEHMNKVLTEGDPETSPFLFQSWLSLPQLTKTQPLLSAQQNTLPKSL